MELVPGRWLVWTALAAGAAILLVEGVFLYRFYAEPPNPRDAPRAAAVAGASSPGIEAPVRDPADYLEAAGALQDRAAEASQDVEEAVLRYDGLDADDVRALGEDAGELSRVHRELRSLGPPPDYEGYHRVLVDGVGRLRAAAALAYRLAADPGSAEQEDFETYRAYTEEGMEELRRAGGMLEEKTSGP